MKLIGKKRRATKVEYFGRFGGIFHGFFYFRPECSIHADCPSYLACVQQKCQDPCPGSCGENAQCYVVNHNVVCQCLQGYEGDPFVRCKKPKPRDPCVPNPCGPNSDPERSRIGFGRDGGGVCKCRCRPGEDEKLP